MERLEVVDVAIAGGGPAGAATALALARLGRRVLLADAGGPGKRFRVGEGLPPAALPLLRAAGLMERFLADGHRVSFGNVSAWGSERLQAADFIRQLHGHGYQLDRARFDAMLRSAAAEAGALCLEGARLSLDEAAPPSPGAAGATQAEGAEGGTVLRLRHGGREAALRCRWVVDAGGRAAVLSRRLGATRRRLDRLVAFSLLLRSDAGTDQDGRTLVEADAQGWWYSVLLPSGQRLATYLSDADLLGREDRGIAGLWRRLRRMPHLSGVCARHGYTPLGTAQGADASSGRLDRFAGPGWLAVGDAALSFDPLSSQGIAMAMHTAARAAQALHAALEGDGLPLARHVGHLEAIHQAYLQHHRTFYAAEARWSCAPFWQRRH